MGALSRSWCLDIVFLSPSNDVIAGAKHTPGAPLDNDNWPAVLKLGCPISLALGRPRIWDMGKKEGYKRDAFQYSRL